jgi:hypothetical protein
MAHDIDYQQMDHDKADNLFISRSQTNNPSWTNAFASTAIRANKLLRYFGADVSKK